MSPAEENPPTNPEEEAAPVNVLKDFEEEVSAEFVPRLRRRLHRRIFTGQVTQFSFSVPGMLLLEFLQLIFGFLPARAKSGSDSQKENRP